MGTYVLPHKTNLPHPRKLTLNIMEENNQNDAERPVEEAIDQQHEQVDAADALQTVSDRPRRKNGRNSRANSGAQSKSASNSAVCGEISDISSVSEKLSGANVNGYRSGKRRAENSENGEIRQFDAEDAENGESQEHDGPLFEQRKFTPRTFEVGLEDRRPRHRDNSKNQEGVVSYSSAEEAACPPVSLLARIKSMLKSLFRSKKNKKFDKRRKFDKNQKRDFHGKKKFGNSKNFGKDGKNFNHRKHQNRGRHSQQSRPNEQ